MAFESSKVTSAHLRRLAYLYVRQSSLHQVQENRESTARQYNLKRRAEALGWSAEQVVVIDEDLGLSGSSSVERSGFQRLVADVGLGRVGIVMGLEVSRLARNSSDWHRLLELCALSDTLILDEDGTYDPTQFNDRLLLGLKGTMSEAELHIVRARLWGGKLNKARRGELRMRAPIGYVMDREGHLSLDPDAQIQGAVRHLFETYRRTGAACQVARHFRKEGLLFPRRLITGPRAGEVVFTPLITSQALYVLHNPRYAGAFVYGRTRSRKVAIGRTPRFRVVSRAEWRVLIPNAHPGYIAWEEYEANQATLLRHSREPNAERWRDHEREGVALLQGLVICGNCGRRMTVQYETRRGQALPIYMCAGESHARGDGRRCQIVRGSGVDAAVAAAVLDAVNPAAIDVAIEVFDELRARQHDVDRARRAQVDRAREEAELAQRQFLLVRPENRLVADTLERQWNDKLKLLTEAQGDYDRASKASATSLTEQDRDRVHALVRDFPRIWNDSRTAPRERKRMLRLLVEDVTLLRHERIDIHVRWRGGATASLDVPLPTPFKTPPATADDVRALATQRTDQEIANMLNGRGLVTGSGRPFTRQRVRSVREALGIPGLAGHLRAHGWLSTGEVSARLHVHPTTAIRCAVEGLLQARRADDKGTLLFAPLPEPLPNLHLGKQYRHRRPLNELAAQVRKDPQYAT